MLLLAKPSTIHNDKQWQWSRDKPTVIPHEAAQWPERLGAFKKSHPKFWIAKRWKHNKSKWTGLQSPRMPPYMELKIYRGRFWRDLSSGSKSCKGPALRSFSRVIFHCCKVSPATGELQASVDLKMADPRNCWDHIEIAGMFVICFATWRRYHVSGQFWSMKVTSKCSARGLESPWAWQAN